MKNARKRQTCWLGSARPLSDSHFAVIRGHSRFFVVILTCGDLSMEIKVNGEIRKIEASPTLLEFLQSLDLPSLERGVAVCVNGEVVRKAEWPGTRVMPQDELEIVNATQGG